ncbi:MAG: deoxyhypusine synthase family protein [Candidatus Anstonellales archaeon]
MYSISSFIEKNYKHFNAASLYEAAKAYKKLIDSGGKMFLAMAGAMSTAELGISLAEMIRKDKVHAISCTGANLEEDLYNLVANKHYLRIPDYRLLTLEHEKELLNKRMCRVTDTAIPEDKAMLYVEKQIVPLWKKADGEGKRRFPHEYFYELLLSGQLNYDIDPKNSWLMAAAEKNLPLFVPGWEDSTLGNNFVARVIRGEFKNRFSCMKTGLEYMEELVKWYLAQTNEVGFFQIGGGIAGDFPICVVPLINIDLKQKVPCWAYFCQISDSTTSYGGYSGAVPNEKITWGKIDTKTPSFVIESDATIVAPLIFAYILGW